MKKKKGQKRYFMHKTLYIEEVYLFVYVDISQLNEPIWDQICHGLGGMWMSNEQFP